MRKIFVLLTALSIMVVFASCGTYYRVKDPASDSTYYTKTIETNQSGAVKFEDGKTGSKVTLQNSEVTEISKKDYKTGITMDKGEKAGESAPKTQ